MSTTKKCKRCYDKNLLKECACGCGSIITDRDSNSRLRTYKHGHRDRIRYPNPIIKGKEHYNWQGGRWIDSKGYVHLSIGHHRSRPEHIMIMERQINRSLLPNESVHHVNGIKDDNRVENLQLVTKSEHANIHNPKGEHRTHFWNKYEIIRDKQTGRIITVNRRH